MNRKKFRLIILLCIAIGFCIAWIYLEKSMGTIISREVVITEICTQNSTCAYDENGEYGADYIELYNLTDKQINLSGYALSDSESNLQRFVFETATIEPHDTLIVWNNEDINGTDCFRDDYVSKDVHNMSFALNQGETVYLSDSRGTVIQKIFISHVNEGMVLSSTHDELDNFMERRPTPYFVETSYMDKTNMVSIAAPEFSMPSGWYKDDFYVWLKSNSGIVYYTLDGSEPNENSRVFDEPIHIFNRSQMDNIYSSIDNISLINEYLPDYPVDKGTVVKAISIDDYGNKSEVVSRTFFVGLDGDDAYHGIAIIEITMDPNDLFDSKNGIYVLGDVYENYLKKYDTEEKPIDLYRNANYAKEGRGWERKAHIDYYNSNHDLALEQDVGIRIHGGWSVAFNQKGFNIYARSEYDGNDTFKYNFFGNKYDKIMLRTGGYRDTYSTKLRDAFNQSLVEDRSIGTQQSEPCAVFLNGEYWGLYNLQETIGTSYVYAHYGIAPDNVIIMKNAEINTVEDDKKYWDDILQYVGSHDLSTPKNYKYICDRIDIQSYIDYFCYQIYIANCDSIANNHARWRSKTVGTAPYEDGKWRWLLYDTDDSVGMVTDFSSYDIDSFIGGHWSIDPLGGRGDVLFSALMDNKEFKELFISTFIEMADRNFNYDRITKELKIKSGQYENAMVKSQERFLGNYEIKDYLVCMNTDQYTVDNYRYDISVIDEFYKKRAEYIIPFMYEDLKDQ